jgi:aminoglycoside 6'-N-acetyltransferase I
VKIRDALPADCSQLAPLRHDLWPDASVEEHAAELSRFFSGENPGTLPTVILVADDAGRIAGFVEVGLRSHADGCDPSRPVGYLEGWYVIPSQRRRKVGARLVEAAERWARDRGCREMASDTWLDNEVSQRAHAALGFEGVDRCVNDRKLL